MKLKIASLIFIACACHAAEPTVQLHTIEKNDLIIEHPRISGTSFRSFGISSQATGKYQMNLYIEGKRIYEIDQNSGAITSDRKPSVRKVDGKWIITFEKEKP